MHGAVEHLVRNVVDAISKHSVTNPDGSVNYVTAYELADIFRVRKYMIYDAVRMARDELKIGIHTTSRGYCLSTKASAIDDVKFMLRMMGLKRQVAICAESSCPDIARKWRASGSPNKKAVISICKDLKSEKKSVWEDRITIMLNIRGDEHTNSPSAN